MKIPPAPNESDIAGVTGRRSSRLSIIVPVTMHGIDAAEEEFQENTWTISVNKHGGRIATFHPLMVDDEVVIENPLLGRSAKARVTRVGDKHFAEDPFEVCVELLEPQNVWGVKLPPDDWLRDREIDSEARTRPAPGIAPPAPASATMESGGKAEVPRPAPLASQAALNPEAAQPAEAPEAAGAAGVEAEHKVLAEQSAEAESVRRELSLLAACAQSARAEAESLLLKVQEARREYRVEVEREAQSLFARVRSELESAVGELSQKADREMAEKLESAVEKALEGVARDFNKQAEDARELLTDGLRSAEDKCLEEARAQLGGAGASALNSLEAEAVAAAARFREQLEATLRELQGQQTRELEEGIQTRLQGQFESLRTSIQLSAQESAARAAAEVQGNSEGALRDLTDRLYKGVGMAALTAREWEEQAKTRLEAHSVQFLDAFRRQLEALTAAAQERQQSDAEALRRSIQDRLTQAARLFGTLETAGQPAASGEEAGVSAGDSQPPAENFPPPIPDPPVANGQAAVEETLASFRSQLGQALARPAPKE